MIYGLIALAGVALLIVGVVVFINWGDWGFAPALIGVLLSIVGFFMWVAHTSCLRLGVQVERQTDFYLNGGCFVTLDNGRSVPIDENSLGLLLEILDER